ncbi:nucleotidyltransferase family protein [Motilimonas eburnea]|uniref:nucleotidyltransferase family protein n=1 Tax=Motilimonas eburnea TaxID=1737488 RepID=UPI001E438938|nr:nucleotidyltransferase family protein [Motilimonas eburnea]MCE2572323.1 nucleotidyltransferase family protein [Motilimonas eburnea]
MTPLPLDHTNATQCFLALLRQDDGDLSFSASVWNQILLLGERTQLIGVLAEYLLPFKARLPERAIQRLDWAQQMVRHQQQSVNMALQQLGEALAPYSPMLLKGAAYHVANTRNASGRMMSDIDVLIPKQDLERAERSLWLHGWDNRGKSAYDEQYYRAWMHELPPFVHKKTGIVLDLHHHWLPNDCRWQFDIERVRSRAQPLADMAFSLPDPIDLCLHACAHLWLGGEGDKGWRDLRDIFLLSQAVTSEQLFLRASELNLIQPFARTHLLANQLFGEISSDSQASTQSRLQPRFDKGWALKAMLPPSQFNQPWDVTWAKLSFYCRGHLLRMPLSLLLPHLLRKAITRQRHT